MKFLKATVIVSDNATDKIYLTTDLPEAQWGEKCLGLQTTATHKTGADYVRKHFNLEPEIIYSK